MSNPFRGRNLSWLGREGLILPVMVAVVACALIVGAQAGEYHTPEQNPCSDCHTSHSSARGEIWQPTPHLLKNAGGQVPLCLSCHDGSDTHAPDIVANGTSTNPSDVVTTQYSSKFGSSAGFFQSDYLTSPNPCGHSVGGGGAVTAPLSTSYSKPGGLMCSDCHATHGNGNYRNLVPDPNPNHSGSYNIVLATNVKETTPVNVQTPNPAVAYDAGNVAFYTINNIGAWCADCHDMLAQNATGSSAAHFKGHPSDVTLSGTGYHTNVSNWSTPGGVAGTGFGSDVGDSIGGIPRVRYGSPTGSSANAGGTDTVFCLSCHKAHGSKYKYGLVWPYYEGGADMISGCQQCHFK